MARSDDDQGFMEMALQQARLAAAAGEIPVGAVVVRDGVVLGAGHNAPIGQHDPTAHAEIAALRAAARQLGNYRLDDCTLYVTLEPCAMCSGAVLQARLARVVFGAAEPKTGAAGSVLDLFDNPAVNHQTRIEGGVLADQCAALLRHFFQQRRELARQKISWPLRQDALRTPEQAFVDIPGLPGASHYIDDLPTLAGLRLHYVDVGPADSALVFFCVHGQGAWSAQFLPWMQAVDAAGYRVVAPDLIGFGRSDKPKRESMHTAAWHGQILEELLAYLDLPAFVLVVTGLEGAWGLNLLSSAPQRVRGLLLCQEQPGSAGPSTAFLAPFPDRGHQAALRALPQRMPVAPETLAVLRDNWCGPTVFLASDAEALFDTDAVQALLAANVHPVPHKKSAHHAAAVCTFDLATLKSRFAG